MASTEHDDTPKIGFAALASMASDVDADIASARQLHEGPAASPGRPDRPRDNEPYRYEDTGRTDNTRLRKGIIAVCAISCLIVVVSWQEHSGNGAVHQTDSQSAVTPATAASGQSQPETNSLAETKPAPGNGHVFGDSELRYCLAENIRLDGFEQVVDRRNHRQVDAFNAMTKDYNSHCAEFRYREGALERIKSEVEGRRAALVAEGRARVERDRK